MHYYEIGNYSLLELYGDVFGEIWNQSKHEIIQRFGILDDALDATNPEFDQIRQLYHEGPVYAGDLVSKEERTLLCKRGYAAHVIVNGEDGYTACTDKGAAFLRVLELTRGEPK